MKIKEADGRELRRMKRIYLEAFPISERKPFGMMKRKARQGRMEMLALLDGGKLAGMAVTVLHRDMILLDYFAISRELRGKRLGSEAIGLLKERYRGKKLILEIELAKEQAPGAEERIRRKRFYLKNGIEETGIRIRLFGVPMELLSFGGTVSYEEYHSIYEEVIGDCFARRVVRL